MNGDLQDLMENLIHRIGMRHRLAWRIWNQGGLHLGSVREILMRQQNNQRKGEVESGHIGRCKLLERYLMNAALLIWGLWDQNLHGISTLRITQCGSALIELWQLQTGCPYFQTPKSIIWRQMHLIIDLFWLCWMGWIVHNRDHLDSSRCGWLNKAARTQYKLCGSETMGKMRF